MPALADDLLDDHFAARRTVGGFWRGCRVTIRRRAGLPFWVLWINGAYRGKYKTAREAVAGAKWITEAEDDRRWPTLADTDRHQQRNTPR